MKNCILSWLVVFIIGLVTLESAYAQSLSEVARRTQEETARKEELAQQARREQQKLKDLNQALCAADKTSVISRLKVIELFKKNAQDLYDLRLKMPSNEEHLATRKEEMGKLYNGFVDGTVQNLSYMGSREFRLNFPFYYPRRIIIFDKKDTVKFDQFSLLERRIADRMSICSKYDSMQVELERFADTIQAAVPKILNQPFQENPSLDLRYADIESRRIERMLDSLEQDSQLKTMHDALNSLLSDKNLRRNAKLFNELSHEIKKFEKQQKEYDKLIAEWTSLSIKQKEDIDTKNKYAEVEEVQLKKMRSTASEINRLQKSYYDWLDAKMAEKLTYTQCTKEFRSLVPNPPCVGK